MRHNLTQLQNVLTTAKIVLKKSEINQIAVLFAGRTDFGKHLKKNYTSCNYNVQSAVP
jgi:hypothetical protein